MNMLFKETKNYTTTPRHNFKIMYNTELENLEIWYNRKKWKLQNKTDDEVRSCTRGQQHCVCHSAKTQNLPLHTTLMLNQELSISAICL